MSERFIAGDALKLYFVHAMKIMAVLSIVAVFSLGGCHLMPNGSSMDHAEAQKVSDSYMSDLQTVWTLPWTRWKLSSFKRRAGKQRLKQDFGSYSITVGGPWRAN